jgi:hypothetical protein
MKAIVKMLTDDAGVSAETTEVYSNEIPQGVELPYILVDVSSSSSKNTASGVSGYEILSVRVFSFSDRLYTDGTDIGAWDLGELVRTALDNQSGTYMGQVVDDILFESYSTYNENTINHSKSVVEQIYDVTIRR